MMATAAQEEGGHAGGGSSLGSSVFFHIGPMPISEHVFSAWVVMAVLVILSLVVTRNMSLVPRGFQNLVEVIIETLMNTIQQTAGPSGRKFAPLVMTAFIFILSANWLGTTPFFGNIRGFKSPNSNLNITGSMAVVVFFVVQYFAIRSLGIGGYIKEFFVPNPLHILTELTRPVSLALRLFGNIYAGGVLVHTMLALFPIGTFVTFVFLGLELFVGAVQALIFTMLSLVFLSIAVAGHGHEPEHGSETQEEMYAEARTPHH
jgi:F-type H+-transporting ATPase subunit a